MTSGALDLRPEDAVTNGWLVQWIADLWFVQTVQFEHTLIGPTQNSLLREDRETQISHSQALRRTSSVVLLQQEQLLMDVLSLKPLPCCRVLRR